MDGRSVQQTLHSKFLGIIVDTKLTWSVHIDMLCSRLSSACYLIRNFRSTCSPETLLLAYYGVFQSLLSYGILSWGSSCHTQRAFIIQKRVIRYMTGSSYRRSCRALFKNLKY